MNMKSSECLLDDYPMMTLSARCCLAKGEIHCLRLRSDPEQLYYLYLPLNLDETSKVFVSVHGVSRNAQQHVKRNIRRVEKRNVLIVAPLFSKERFPDYQRLGRLGHGLRADYKLLDILDEVKEITAINARRYYLFGYSGGRAVCSSFCYGVP